MLRVYDKNCTDFTNNGLGVLESATKVCITEEINGSYMLSFEMPVDNGKWSKLQTKNIVVCEGQQFRVMRKIRSKDSVINRRVECLHVSHDSNFIPFFAPQIGMSPRNIMLSAFAGTNFHIMTTEEVSNLGMQWVTDLTDVLTMSKTSPWEIVNVLISNLQKGEIYKDNHNIALVERIGRDTGLYCTLANNLQRLEDVEDGASIITRLYAYGKDDLPLPESVAPNGYIDSAEGIAKYGIIPGPANFDTVEDPNELYQKALWLFSPDNPNRVDAPNIAFSVKLVELHKIYGNNFKFSCGDSLRIKSSVLGIDTAQRIVKYNRYPYSADISDVVFGRPPKTDLDLTKMTVETISKYKRATTSADQIKSTRYENIKAMVQTQVNAMLQNALLNVNPNLYYDDLQNPTKAMIIGPAGFAVANSKKADGSWDWRLIGTGDKFVADEVNAAWVYAGHISADQITAGILQGITIRTAASGPRLELSTANGLLQYDTSGNKTIEIVSSPNVTSGSGAICLWKNNTLIGWLKAESSELQLWADNHDLIFGTYSPHKVSIYGDIKCGGARFYDLKNGDGVDYATKNWVQSQGYITGTMGYTGYITIGDVGLNFSNGLLTGVFGA